MTATALAERVLGFDARVLCALRPLGDSALLRGSVPRPCSVDATVWPSLFNVSELAQHRLTFAPLDRGRDDGVNGILWEDVDDLTARLAAADAARAPSYAIVAVTCWLAAADATAPPDGAWRPLGFDVADEWLDSALMNMWSDRALPAARTCYGGRLNGHHLFDSVDDARAFGADADRRVRSHAPFSVYGIYVLRTVPPDAPV